VPFEPSQRRFPHTRLRRMRAAEFSRSLMRESHLTPSDLIYPLFVIEGEGAREEVRSMPGVSRLSIDLLVREAREAHALGVPAVALFPVTPPSAKSLEAEEAFNPNGLGARARRPGGGAVPGDAAERQEP